MSALPFKTADAWRASHLTAAPPESAEQLRLAMYGHVMRLGWTLDQLARGDIEDPELGPPQRLHFRAPRFQPRLSAAISRLLIEIERAMIEPAPVEPRPQRSEAPGRIAPELRPFMLQPMRRRSSR
jgi:hypothetical protein